MIINNIFPKNLICLSHLRWDFVYQRPQHLLSRFAKNTNVYFFEEPIYQNETENYLSISQREDRLRIVVPHLREGLNEQETQQQLALLFDKFIDEVGIDDSLFWYYTPMALKYTEKHRPKAIVYDCMDELSGFKFAHSDIGVIEQELMAKADIVFTGGLSLYEAKKQYHNNIYPFPSSIDKNHFAKACNCDEAEDQATIKGPKIGFFGVIDERFDTELIRDLAEKQPDWQIILIGPVVKIDPATLPQNTNIHYLGQKSYQDLPAYLAGWNVALLPFLLNESTRFISPTKTPEYLAAGIPVVSTPIHDVVNPYGNNKLVHICNDSDDFAKAINRELSTKDRSQWQAQVEEFLKFLSWDLTQKEMETRICSTIKNMDKISIAS